MLLFGKGQPTKRTAKEHPRLLGLGRREAQTRIEHGLLGCRERELRVPVEATGALGVEVIQRVKIIDLRRYLRTIRGRVEPIEGPDRRLASEHALPQSVPPVPKRRDCPYTRNYYSLQRRICCCQ
jgi:hypothetical protein